MKIIIAKIKQYNAGYLNILMIDGEPVACAKSENRVAQFVAYINGSENVTINDGKIKKALDKYRSKKGEVGSESKENDSPRLR